MFDITNELSVSRPTQKYVILYKSQIQFKSYCVHYFSKFVG